MEHKPFTDEILKKIQEENLQPKARWKFVLVHSALWLSGILALGIGSIAVSAGLFVMRNSDIDVYGAVHGAPWLYALKSIPLLWILSLVVFIVIADIVFKHTGKGYRYALWALIVGSVLTSVLIGSFLYLRGIGHVVEYRIGRHIPLYNDVFERKIIFWTAPLEGRLAGVVSENEGVRILTDARGGVWKLGLDLVPPAQQLVFNHASSVALVGFVGEEEHVFIVCAVRPWVLYGEALPMFGIPMGANEGLVPLRKADFDKLRDELHSRDFSERNLFEIRNTMCERRSADPKGRINQ